MLLYQALPLSFALVAAVPYQASFWSWGWGWSDPLIAYTTNGPIIGHPAPNRSAVTEYLGVRYAEAPVGNLRFAAPKEYLRYGIQNASSWGHECPAAASSTDWKYPGITEQAARIVDVFDNQPVNRTDEDCLFLNIWTRRAQHGRHRSSPVIVVFHGGLFTHGGTNTPFYYGQYWVDAEDIVIVTVNFRANVFGFPNIPDSLQNFGIRDQRVAVEWLRDNIAAFGGDPSRITILGQSAGSVAIDYWAYAYIDDPIVNGLISHSGNALSFGLGSDSAKPWYNISSQLGCGESGDTLPCMREKSWQDIEKASQKLPSAKTTTPLRSIPAFYPVADNVTVFADYVSLSNAGKFARVPYLLGNNNYEQGSYQFGVYQAGINVTQKQGDDFLESSFTCPNDFEASNRRRHNVSVWQFRNMGDWDNLKLYPTSGAYHGSDVAVLFGNDGGISGISPTQAEQDATAWWQHAWTSFVADPVHGLTNLGWPEYDLNNGKSLALIANKNSATPTFVSPSEFNAPCSTIKLAGAPSAT